MGQDERAAGRVLGGGGAAQHPAAPHAAAGLLALRRSPRPSPYVAPYTINPGREVYASVSGDGHEARWARWEFDLKLHTRCTPSPFHMHVCACVRACVRARLC